MGVIKTFGRLSGFDSPGAIRDTFKNDNATKADKVNILLDPHSRLAPEPPKSSKELGISAKKKEKKRKEGVYANAFKHGYKGKKPTGMKKGGKVKTHTPGDCCRGMGAATRGGKFRKDG